MRWDGRRKSENVEDRRNTRVSGVNSMGNSGGLLRLIPAIVKVLGFKGTAIVVICVGAYGLFTGNLTNILGELGVQGSNTVSTSSQPLNETAAERDLVDFVAVVLADTEDTWSAIFQQNRKIYTSPRLVLFRNAVQSACGMAESAMGLFYCPADQQVYIDLSFFDQLHDRFKAPGDFAQAYVIAHEVGHHVQNLLGISSKVQEARSKLGKIEANKLSVSQELPCGRLGLPCQQRQAAT